MHSVRTVTAATLAAVLVATGIGFAQPGVASANRAAAPPPAATDQPEPAHTVTLISGDQVVRTAEGTAVRPAPGRSHLRFITRHGADGQYVVPMDAQPLIAAGVLDRQLFNITNLISYGYHDAARDDLPLIVAYPDGVASRAELPAGLRITQELAAIDGAAARAGKATAARFWAGLTNAATATEGPTRRPYRIWLDGKRRLLLDRSAAQIGAPAAHAAGLTGAGVTVAVLDSGIDATHPDLVGTVARSRNFTDDPDPADLVGHGTHVASIIAGSGAASGGANRGVAPDATLISGKVCESSWCTESAILAGMHWAAERQDASVINLSLGGWDSPEIDPLEQAVETLTARTGALFVIAAGNSGQERTVASPGSADAALTVGAVDRDDTLADFSSRGPRTGDDAVKPDLTAPGVGIVAARAAGTTLDEPVGEHYVAASGTSMSTPHVAAAAALLAQRRPDWAAGQLKAALMASAAPSAGATAYQQGAGRVDVARAVTQPVTTQPASVSFGRSAWPHHDDEPVAKTVTYRNSGTEPLTLTLSLGAVDPTGAPAPPGMFTHDATEVTVPAGGTADVTVTTDTSVEGPDGVYSGHLVATGGDVDVVTPFGIHKEVESYQVTLRHLDQTGAPTTGYWTLAIGLDQPVDAMPWSDDPDGEVTLRLPAGRYGLTSVVERLVGEREWQTAVLAEPNFRLDADATVTFDARAGKPVRMSIPEETARTALVDVSLRFERDNGGAGVGLLTESFDGLTTGQFGTPPPDGEFSSAIASQWLRPDDEGGFADSPYFYGLSELFADRLPTGLTRTYRPRDLATVRHQFRGTNPGGGTDRFVFPGHTGLDPGAWAIVVPVELPGVRVEHHNVTRTLSWSSYLEFSRPVEGEDWPQYTALLVSLPQRYQPGKGTQDTWNAAPYGPAFPASPSPSGWVSRQGNLIAVDIPMFSDAHGHPGTSLTSTARTALYRDGKLVGQTEEPGYGWFEVPRRHADYRLEVSATRDVSDLSTTVSGIWTFPSGPVARQRTDLLPVLAVRFAPKLDPANTAPAGRVVDIPFTVTHQPGVTGIGVRKPTVEVSYDGGDSWQRAEVTSAKAGWTATVRHPKQDGYVSLRATVVDRAGNTLEQTIHQAYRITVR
ncbi:S8 family serine peptidase [Solwaraspora sp. WMMD406]|uniref:S8 family serine peptidase n=1 Tax=Solwaraspora sp. WMMD406 TaxID=3016095 RepID=UPI0024173996|nr:S8 family serine peptidase [Solwaraspora sp. WMMD406]MDG4767770.1 S8 family serine peptidase [Solwaraspora sp. WMMD406]